MTSAARASPDACSSAAARRELLSGTRTGPVDAKREQIADLLQRETDLLRLPNELDALSGLGRIPAVMVARSHRLLDEAASPMEAHRLHSNPGGLGKLSMQSMGSPQQRRGRHRGLRRKAN
jgi:hypothetical protein